MEVFIPKSFVALLLISSLLVAMTIGVTIERNEVLLLATTTSVDNSGLLNMLISEYLKTTPHLKIYVVAKGTGAALQLAKDGDADAVLVHAKEKELEFVKEGYGINRTTLWYNYFILVGPSSDPAQIKTSQDIIDAFKRLYNSGNETIRFLSRGDESGTHIREQMLWNLSSLTPYNKAWYLETGTGMARTLITANQLNAYTLTDIGTYLQLKQNAGIKLVPVFDKEIPELYNPYSYIVVNPKIHPDRNTARAIDFLLFLKNSLDLVGNYTIDGSVLFHPLKEGRSW